MDEQKTIEEAILQNLSQPKRIQSEVGSVEQHSLPDMIAADKYLEQKRVAKSKQSPLRLFPIEPKYN